MDAFFFSTKAERDEASFAHREAERAFLDAERQLDTAKTAHDVVADDGFRLLAAAKETLAGAAAAHKTAAARYEAARERLAKSLGMHPWPDGLPPQPDAEWPLWARLVREGVPHDELDDLARARPGFEPLRYVRLALRNSEWRASMRLRDEGGYDLVVRHEGIDL